MADFPKLTVVVLALWAIAILLLTINDMLYRLLEGYWGPFNRRSLRTEKTTQFGSAKTEIRQMYDTISTSGASESTKNDYYKKQRQFGENWPAHEGLVLPSRFGNVIRAFESYPYTVYGVDSIPVWPRLLAVVPKAFSGLLDGARAEVDFFVNLWLMAILAAGVAAARLAVELTQVSQHQLGIAAVCWHFAIDAVIAAIVAWLAYEGAIYRARSWGIFVKAAFDLYLPDLARQLGYELAETLARRRAFWDSVNSMFLYQNPILPDDWPVAEVVPETKDKK